LLLYHLRLEDGGYLFTTWPDIVLEVQFINFDQVVGVIGLSPVLDSPWWEYYWVSDLEHRFINSLSFQEGGPFLNAALFRGDRGSDMSIFPSCLLKCVACVIIQKSGTTCLSPDLLTS
jgi:hypothetical protein